jgi:DNA-binding transcriptional MerR regulator
MDEGFTIAEVAQKTGLTAHTLRYYERAGLLASPSRGWNGHRRYSAQDIGVLNMISRLRATGMSIADTRRYADMCAEGPATMPARKALLEEHRRQVIAKIEELQGDLALIDYKIGSYTPVDA